MGVVLVLAALAGYWSVYSATTARTPVVAAAHDLLRSPEPAGRRLDFLAQEFNREANTLCSKSNDAETTRIGLELKAVIEQMREQVQNIE